MSPPPLVLQLQIPACVDGAELSGLLACSDFLGLWEEDGSFTIYWQGREGGMVAMVKKALAQLNAQILDSSLQAKAVPLQDWNAQWAASVQPIRIGRRIGVRPSWMTMELPEDGIEIVLDPKQAFGTGHHATTALLLEWLEDSPFISGSSVLDVGAGSGLLSMVALRLGAISALGIDVDPVAINCARDYAQVNGFEDDLVLRSCQLDELEDQYFDIILANIDRKTILEISPEFLRFRAFGTQLLLSGLLEDDRSEIVDHFVSQGWNHYAVREREGWIALQFGMSFVG